LMTRDKKYHIYFFTKLIFALLLGVIITFVTIQRSDNFKLLLKDYIIAYLASSLDRDQGDQGEKCEVICEIDAINLFSPTIRFSHLAVKPIDPNNKAWSFVCKNSEIRFSWLDLMLNGVIDLYITMHEGKITSAHNKQGIAVLPKIMSLFEGDDWVQTIIKSFIIKRGVVQVKGEREKYSSEIQFASITKHMSGAYKTKISFLDGNLCIYDKSVFDNLSGFVGVNVVQKSQNTYVYLDSKCTVDAQFLKDNKTCFVTGKWVCDQGTFDIISQDKSFSVAPIKLYFLGDTLFTEFNLEGSLGDLTEFVFAKPGDLSGKCAAQLRSEFGPLGFGSSGSVMFRDITYNGLELFSSGKVTFKNSKSKHTGFLCFERQDGLMINGDLDFDSQKNTLSCNIFNETVIALPSLPYWKVAPKKAKLNIAYNKYLTGACSCCAISEQLGTHIDVSSDIALENNILGFSGSINDKKYALDLYLFPYVSIKNFTYKDNDKKSLIALSSLEQDQDKNKFTGSIRFPFIKSLAKEYFDYDILGEGDLKLHGMRKDNTLLLQLSFTNGSVSFPDFYNFLHDFKITCKIDPRKKAIIAKDSVINLHKGQITCKKAVLQYNDSFAPLYVYAPIIYKNCFVNVKNDFFALISGRLLFSQKYNTPPHLVGLTIIERSHLKNNIFSTSEDTAYAKPAQITHANFNTYLQSISCDISVITKTPTRINTEFVHTAANIDLSMKNKLLHPEFLGKIDFLSGSLLFPYKPLVISKGAIYFLPHQSGDPLIELVARNKISKYNIAMYITGSFENQHISFESSPPLTEEQIMALLIAGSAQESLNVVAPALIMQKLKDSLFGSGTSKVGKKDYLGKFLKPFKKIRIVPSFIDQTGRGGLRGTVEVDINNRWRALVEKNFSLSEDTRFEIEYLLSDDVSVRGLRRENGDIGGEVEMRWKF